MPHSAKGAGPACINLKYPVKCQIIKKPQKLLKNREKVIQFLTVGFCEEVSCFANQRRIFLDCATPG